MHHKCNFSLWAQGEDSSFVEDRAFSCYAQAQEGDFTAGQNKLNNVAQVLAYNWVHGGVNPNDPKVYRNVCELYGVDYDELLDQEVDYLSKKIEEEIRKA